MDSFIIVKSNNLLTKNTNYTPSLIEICKNSILIFKPKVIDEKLKEEKE